MFFIYFKGGGVWDKKSPAKQGFFYYVLKVYLIIQNIVGYLYQVQDVYIAILSKVSSAGVGRGAYI